MVDLPRLEFDTRKAHIKRLFAVTKDSDGVETEDRSAWIDMYRIDQFTYVDEKGIKFAVYLLWEDEPLYPSQTTKESEENLAKYGREISTKRLTDPQADYEVGTDPEFWFNIPIIDMVVLEDRTLLTKNAPEIRKLKFINDNFELVKLLGGSDIPEGFLIGKRKLWIKRVVHWDTSTYPEEENVFVKALEYERAGEEDDTQYIDQEIPQIIHIEDNVVPDNKRFTVAMYNFNMAKNFRNVTIETIQEERQGKLPPIRLDPFQQIVNVQLSKGATEVEDGSRVELDDDIGTTNKIVVAVAFKIVEPAPGQIPLMTFGVKSENKPGGTIGPPINTPMNTYDSAQFGVFWSGSTISIAVGAEVFTQSLHLCSFDTTKTQTYSLETTASSSGFSNILHMGNDVPTWAPFATSVTGPGLPSTGILGWATDNSNPPLVRGDVTVTSLVGTPAGTTLTFTVSAGFFHSPAGDRDDIFNLETIGGGSSKINDDLITSEDGWFHVAISLDTSGDRDVCFASVNGFNCSPEPQENTRRSTGNPTNGTGGYVMDGGSCPNNLLYDQPKPPYPVYIEIPGFDFTLGPSIGLPHREIDVDTPNDNNVTGLVIGYADVQVWVGKSYDVGKNAKKFARVKPATDEKTKNQLLLRSPSVIQEELGQPNIWLTGVPEKFIKNRGSGGVDFTKTGELKKIKGPKYSNIEVETP